jgi:ribosomal protein L7/L12
METGLGLKNAKSCTDRLLEGDVIEVQVELDQSEDVLRSLHQLGVDVELTEDPPDKPTQTDGPSDRR